MSAFVDAISQQTQKKDKYYITNILVKLENKKICKFVLQLNCHILHIRKKYPLVGKLCSKLYDIYIVVSMFHSYHKHIFGRYYTAVIYQSTNIM